MSYKNAHRVGMCVPYDSLIGPYYFNTVPDPGFSVGGGRWPRRGQLSPKVSIMNNEFYTA